LECRDALHRWGITIPPRQNVHSFVRLRFLYAANADLNALGQALDKWCRFRNQAHYDLSALSKFTSKTLANDAIQESAAALALLAAIEPASVRPAAAIAAFPP